MSDNETTVKDLWRACFSGVQKETVTDLYSPFFTLVSVTDQYTGPEDAEAFSAGRR